MATQIQLRGGTAAQWTAANPVLAEREVGVETDTGLFKIGNGASVWSALPYNPLRNIDTATVVSMANQAHPTPPSAGNLNVYARSLAGKMLLRQQGPSGLTSPLQPSLFQNNVAIASAGSGTALNVLGTGLTTAASATVSHPQPPAGIPYMANIVSGSTAGNGAGTGDANLRWFMGGGSGLAAGFFFYARVFFPDSSYDHATGATGTRILLGMTGTTMLGAVQADALAANTVGLARVHHGAGVTHTNWQLGRRGAGANADFTDTGVAFLPSKVYDAFLFSPPGGGSLFWRIDNLTDNVSAEGSVSDNLPQVDTALRAGVQLLSINGAARNLRFQRIYVESDY